MRKSVLPLSPYPTSLVLRLLLDEKQARKNLDKDTLATTALLENNIILVDFDLSASRRKDKQLL